MRRPRESGDSYSPISRSSEWPKKPRFSAEPDELVSRHIGSQPVECAMGISLKVLRYRAARLVVAALFLTSLVSTIESRAGGTSYEAQISGFTYSVLQTLILGEFSGQSSTNETALGKPVCRFEDYEVLRATSGSRSALADFQRRCRLIEIRLEKKYVRSIAYLPKGYCEPLKTAFESVLREHVHNAQAEPSDFVTFSYKGSNYSATRRGLARATFFDVICEVDGSLRVGAKQKK